MELQASLRHVTITPRMFTDYEGWQAHYCGPVYTEPPWSYYTVDGVSAIGKTPAEALELLTAAMAEQGWILS